ncbi:craniofacial development protein 2-like [Elysia marginata]|uniref:Craniofacial development protein 2-like n=1 Tax=Elysia marginata TaxID=1093978 RepID=A0AAV4HY93_9GAST|nr:craniofacial development protein 2-like [Elysia marginata]
MTLDRQQATASRLKLGDKMKIATWNVRTMLQKGKFDNIKQEIDRMKISTGISGVSEVRRKGAGNIVSEKFQFIFSGGSDHERGVGVILDQKVSKALNGYWQISDRVLLVKIAGKPMDINIIQVYAPTSASSNEDLEKFYEELEQAKSNCKNDEPTFIMGDFNAKVGERGEEKSLGQHGLGIRNERGEHLVEWCETNDLLIANTCFKQPLRRKWTWKKPGDDTKNQIDYILVNDRFKNALLSAKSYPGADCFSDHVPVVAVVRLKLKKIKTQPGNIKLNIGLLKADQDLRQRYTVAVKRRFQGLEEFEEVEQHWQNLKEAITEAASTVIPPMRQKAKQKWMTDEILDLIDKRRQAKNDKEVYENLHRVIRKKCDEVKEV